MVKKLALKRKSTVPTKSVQPKKRSASPALANGVAMSHHIIKETQPWGVRLIARPFSDPRLASMELSAEVSHPRGARSPEIKVWFGSVPVQNPLRPADVVIWQEAMRALMNEVRTVSGELKRKAESKPPKKPPSAKTRAKRR